MKKHLSIAAITLASIFGKDAVAAPDTLFTIPDTICAGNLVTPEVLVRDGQNYNWKFCSPPLSLPPTGVNIEEELGVLSPADVVVVRDEAFFVGWMVNRRDGEGLVRWNFRNGIEEIPEMRAYGDLDGTLPVNPSGLELIKDDGKWYLFVIGGTDGSNSTLARYTFDNAMHLEMEDSVNLGNLGGMLNEPQKLFIGKDGDDYIGYTFNNGRNLIKLDFGTDITSTPVCTDLGNIGNVFTRVTAITGIKEGDNWHLHVTDRLSNALVKLTFGTSLHNVPFAVDYGSIEGNLNYPSGVAIVPDCMEYYGYVINNIGSHLNTLYWDEAVADTPVAWNNGNIGDIYQPTAMSHFVEDSGRLYLFVTNGDSTLTRLKFENCGSANYAGSGEMNPEPFTYYTPGTYNVYLTIDQGMPTVRSYCKPIVVVAPPDVQYSNDTLICVGDTIMLQTLYSEDVPVTWTPDYNISATDEKVVYVWPDFSATYTSTVPFYENCTLVRDFVVEVSQIAADAGADRSITDGSSVILGGPMTSLGEEYNYNWFPTDYFTGSAFNNITSAKPGKSITYYLEVRNTDGCYAIDSVIITMNCDDITLPNAFVPEGKSEKTAIFGLMNLQFEKLNSFTIYDRWGNQVFYTTDLSKGWNGTHEGKDCPLGVYIWEIDAFCSDGYRIRKQGNVTLVR
ncbi:MAG: gliding motility-associated C-terminal domain-containing protein [Taibaiella sp.]|nr:gliding motility-associated C-terminal domain-containing protein [Taibaiella sp.]